MWFLFALITFFAWGTADLFYKRGTPENQRYSHLKTSIMVGVVMGITAIATLLIKQIDYDPVNLLLYLPVSAMYILSMSIGYFGLRYLELSVSSPIQNASGAVSCLILIFALRELPSPLEIVAVLLITFGVVLLGVLEKQKEDEFVAAHQKKYKIGLVAFFMPILYCIIDSLGTALDGIYLDDPTTSPLRYTVAGDLEDVANISYMLTFFLVALLLAFYLYFIRKEPLPRLDPQDPVGQASRPLAAVCEVVGQLTYVYAMSGNGLVAAPLIASYCVVSVLLARVFLKEKLTSKQYLMIFFVFLGILLLGLAEEL